MKKNSALILEST